MLRLSSSALETQMSYKQIPFRTDFSRDTRFRLRSKSFCVKDCDWLIDFWLTTFLIGLASISAGTLAADFDRSFCAFREFFQVGSNYTWQTCETTWNLVRQKTFWKCDDFHTIKWRLKAYRRWNDLSELFPVKIRWSCTYWTVRSSTFEVLFESLF